MNGIVNGLAWRRVGGFSIVLLVAFLLLIALIWSTIGARSGSNGELIYYRATNDRGEPITYGGAPGLIGPGAMMGTRLSCASCHGQEARGGVHMMHMQVMDAPDIRWSTLAGEAEGEHAGGNDHGDGHAASHAGYGLAEFRMAVVEGRHPEGGPLSSDMPRWNIGDGDLEDLADFLKTPSLTERGAFTVPGDFMSSGVWIVFPIIGIILMVGFMFLMMSRGGGFWSRREGYDRSPRDRHTDTSDSETPLSILKKRYAKGEISKEEYEEMKAEL